MSRTSNKDLYTRELILLRFVQASREGRRGCRVHMSRREMAHALDMSECQVRYSLRRLIEEDYLAIEERHLANGGRLANVYCVTPAGARLLDRCEVAEGRSLCNA